MKYAKPGDRVSVSYIGTLENGRIFDQTPDDHPLVFTIGGGEVFPALENEIIGMRAGEVRNIILACEDAYGLRSDDNLLRVARSSFPVDRELSIGRTLTVDFADGHSLVMRVLEIDQEQVLLDGNHALAGCDLTFALRLNRILPDMVDGKSDRC